MGVLWSPARRRSDAQSSCLKSKSDLWDSAHTYMRQTLLLGAAFAAFVPHLGCSNSTKGDTCGSGTIADDGTCVATGGSGDTCGSGTMLVGTTCVPVGAGSGAPTITKMDPTAAGFTGGGLFTITGTNFTSASTVFFGDTTDANCQATLGAISETAISGQVPVSCSLSTQATVTVTTGAGSATTAFQYIAVFAADGDADPDPNGGSSNELWIIDPVAGMSLDLGPLEDGSGNAYGMSGIAFGANGTLFAATTGDSAADQAGSATSSQLVTISLAVGSDGSVTSTVTPVGPVTDDAIDYTVSDMKFSGTTLYGWAYFGTTDGSNETFTQTLVTIDTTTGAATEVGSGAVSTFGLGGLAIDSTGTVFVAANGAGSDTTDGATGEFDSLNTTTGAPTSVATLDWGYPGPGVGAPIEAMAYVGSALLAVVDDGIEGLDFEVPLDNEELVLIDTTQTPIVNALFEAPSVIGGISHVDAMDVAPSTVSINAKLPANKWTHLAAGVTPTRSGTVSHRAHKSFVRH
jgi:hypothetical protein